MPYVLILLGIVLLYFLIPDVLFHVLHFGVFRRGQKEIRQVALTFDDGPDPAYTPHVLRILKDHQVSATFFVLGRKANEYPDLIRQIVSEGHEIAIHGQSHRHAWILSPWGTLTDIRKSRNLITTITGTAPRFYRPPWGMFNLVTALVPSALGLKLVLYDVEGKDWFAGDRTLEIVDSVNTKLHGGAVILLHDSGGAMGAPLNTIRALPAIIGSVQHQGYSLVKVSILESGHPSHRSTSLFMRLWLVWERVFARMYHVSRVTDLIHVAPVKFKGPVKTVNGQIVLQSGDPCLELHFKSDVLVQGSVAGNTAAGGLAMLRQCRTDFPILAQALQRDPRFVNVRGLIGISMFHRGAPVMGFHVEEVQPLWQRRWFNWYMRFLMRIYHREGGARLKKRPEALEVRFLWFPREEFLSRYLPKETPAVKSE